MKRFDTFGRRKAVLGVIHVAPLPGTPFSALPFDEIRDRVVRSADALMAGGADGCLIQTADRVYSPRNEADPARVAAMTLLTHAVAAATGDAFHVGVQIMRNAISASLAVARLAHGTFVRATALTGLVPSPDGLIEASPLEVAAYRRTLDATAIRIVADVASMHHALAAGMAGGVAGAARQAINAGADAVALSDPDETTMCRLIADVRNGAPDVPIILAGQTTHENARRLVADADGVLVGRCLERDGWGSAIDVDRVRAYVDIVRSIEGV